MGARVCRMDVRVVLVLTSNCLLWCCEVVEIHEKVMIDRR